MIGVGDVAGDCEDAFEAADRALQRVPVTRVHHDPPASLGESAGEREPEPARGAGDDGLHGSGRLDRHAVAGHDPVVVEPHQLDHVADVFLVLDPARPVAGLAGEDGVVVDPALIEQRPARRPSGKPKCAT